MRWKLMLAITSVICVGLQPAYAGVFVSGSISSASFNNGLQTQESAGGSGTVGFELGQYIRLGYTHKRQIQTREGWMGDTEGECVFPDTLDTCIEFKESTYVIADSLDLTLVLYNGELIAPYLLGGLILKTIDYKINRADGKRDHVRGFAPGPNLGGGLHIRLNRKFALKLQYTVSPGKVHRPDRTERDVWDRDASLGLTYQL